MKYADAFKDLKAYIESAQGFGLETLTVDELLEEIERLENEHE